MGYYEAIEDGIKIISSEKTGGETLFYPLCSVCGKETFTLCYKRNVKYLCKDCKLQKYLQDKEQRNAKSNEKKDKKFEKAVKRIKDKAKDFSKYTDAIEIVQKKLHNEGWFQSTEEIMAAIELEKNKIKYRHQVKIGSYRVDFVLDDLKILLEIDGVLFHTENTKEKENLRDNLLCIGLGAEWEVIRITDKLLNENVSRLVSALKKTYKARKKVREKNFGMLPEWYTNRKI